MLDSFCLVHNMIIFATTCWTLYALNMCVYSVIGYCLCINLCSEGKLKSIITMQTLDISSKTLEEASDTYYYVCVCVRVYAYNTHFHCPSLTPFPSAGGLQHCSHYKTDCFDWSVWEEVTGEGTNLLSS